MLTFNIVQQETGKLIVLYELYDKWSLAERSLAKP